MWVNLLHTRHMEILHDVLVHAVYVLGDDEKRVRFSLSASSPYSPTQNTKNVVLVCKTHAQNNNKTYSGLIGATIN